MAYINVNSINIDKPKLSDEPAFQKAYITFSFDSDVSAYVLRCMGTNHETGKFVDGSDKYVSTQASNHSVLSASRESVRSFSSFLADTLLSAELSYVELYQEGENRVNVYARSLEGNWTNQMGEEVKTIKEDITFEGITSSDLSKRVFYSVDSSSPKGKPFYSTSNGFTEFSLTDYQNIAKLDGSHVVKSSSSSLTKVQYVFYYAFWANTTNIKQMTFQIKGEFNQTFYMMFWNEYTQSWDNNTRVNFDGYGEGIFETKINNIAPYNDNGYFAISVNSVLSGDFRIDFAKLVVERTE